MIALVTGSSGFIGSHVAARLEADGYRVRRLVRRQSSVRDVPGSMAERVTVDFDRADLGVNPASLADAELVIHAAGVTRGVDERTFHRGNAEATHNLLSALAAAGAKPRRTVLISSQAAAGPAETRDNAVTEDHDPRPIEPYGRSKLEAERHMEAFGDRLPFTVVRPSAVYGPGDRDFLTIFRMLRHRVALYAGNRDSWLSIVHVRDLVDGIIRAVAGRVEGRTLFIANTEPVQWRDVYRSIAGAMNNTPAIDVEVPRPLLRVAAKAGDISASLTGRPPLMTTNKLLLGEQPYWICSSDLARRELGWWARIPLSEGMRETYDWSCREGRIRR